MTHVFPNDNIRKTFTVMHNPVFEESDALSFVLLACTILYINGKQFKCSVFTFVQYINYMLVHRTKILLVKSTCVLRIRYIPFL